MCWLVFMLMFLPCCSAVSCPTMHSAWVTWSVGKPSPSSPACPLLQPDLEAPRQESMTAANSSSAKGSEADLGASKEEPLKEGLGLGGKGQGAGVLGSSSGVREAVGRGPKVLYTFMLLITVSIAVSVALEAVGKVGPTLAYYPRVWDLPAAACVLLSSLLRLGARCLWGGWVG